MNDLHGCLSYTAIEALVQLYFFNAFDEDVAGRVEFWTASKR